MGQLMRLSAIYRPILTGLPDNQRSKQGDTLGSKVKADKVDQDKSQQHFFALRPNLQHRLSPFKKGQQLLH